MNSPRIYIYLLTLLFICVNTDWASQVNHQWITKPLSIPARSVRDRWVNIRSTFNHNLRKVRRTQQNASSPDEVYVPCWTLWKPLQFLRDDVKIELEVDLHFCILASEYNLICSGNHHSQSIASQDTHLESASWDALSCQSIWGFQVRSLNFTGTHTHLN